MTFILGYGPPQIVDFSEAFTGKTTLNEPNDVKASADGFQLKCKASGSTPLTFTWKHNGKTMRSQRGISMTKNNEYQETMWIESTSTYDDGSYQCSVKNQYGSTFSAKIPVRVTCK